MNIFYRILQKTDSENTILVRYWTDIISENSLATSIDVNGDIMMTDKGFPISCRTDSNITFYNETSPSSSDIFDLIKKSAPVGFFKINELRITGSEKLNLSNVELYTANSFLVETVSDNITSTGTSTDKKNSQIENKDIAGVNLILPRISNDVIKYLVENNMIISNTGSNVN